MLSALLESALLTWHGSCADIVHSKDQVLCTVILFSAAQAQAHSCKRCKRCLENSQSEHASGLIMHTEHQATQVAQGATCIE